MTEIWKSIDGFEGLYEVSNLGRVRSLYDGRHNINRTKVLKPAKNRCGYLQVCLHKNRKKKSFLVNRLVASAFLENPQNLPQVNHKDENKQNNTVDNLEWISHKDNNNYGTHNKRVSEANLNNPKLSKSVFQFTKSGELLKEYPSITEAERETGISHGSICQCCLGNRKSAGGFIWKYNI